MNRVAVFVDAGYLFAQGSIALDGHKRQRSEVVLAHKKAITALADFTIAVSGVPGDEDLRVGVQQAQEFGVRVHLLGIKPGRGSQSLSLLQEADTCHEWTAADISQFVSSRAQPNRPESQPPTVDTISMVSIDVSLSEVARRTAFEIQLDELASLVESARATGQLPKDVDSKLLARGRTHVTRDLESSERKAVRRHFIETCEARLKNADAGGQA